MGYIGFFQAITFGTTIGIGYPIFDPDSRFPIPIAIAIAE